MKNIEKLKQDLKTEITNRKKNEDMFIREIDEKTKTIEN